PLPPPVMASTAWCPDACIAAMICRHDASSRRRASAESMMFTLSPRMVEEIRSGVNGVLVSQGIRRSRRALDVETTSPRGSARGVPALGVGAGAGIAPDVQQRGRTDSTIALPDLSPRRRARALFADHLS